MQLAGVHPRAHGVERQLQQLGLDACEREVRWLNELIENEKKETGP